MKEIVVQWSITFVLGGISGYIINWLKKFSNEFREFKTTVIENDIAILWSQLTSKSMQVIQEGKCDIATKECIEQLHKQYKKIGGNHGVSTLVKEALSYCKKEGK